MPAPLFPAFIKLADRACLVVGAGEVAASKIESLLIAGARVTVVAPRAISIIESFAYSGTLTWLRRKFHVDDLSGVFLVIAATSSGEVNRAVYLEAQRCGILCNSVDDPPNCDFYFPAVVRRGDLQIAISTAGESPALAQRIRQDLEKNLDDSLGDWVREIGRRRREIIATQPPSEQRKQLLHQLASSNYMKSGAKS
jgi:precorrin-2 dehydrogenase / sirohydrochlorin ferrochelatase